MKKVNLNNLYESHYPPTDINVLWVDKDENTGKIKAIHEYNKSKGEWEPSMVSVDYIAPGDGDDRYYMLAGSKEHDTFTLKDETNNTKYSCLVIHALENTAVGSNYVIASPPLLKNSTTEGIIDRGWTSSIMDTVWATPEAPIINGNEYEFVRGVFCVFNMDDNFTHQFLVMSDAQYNAFKTGKTVVNDSFALGVLISKQ